MPTWLLVLQVIVNIAIVGTFFIYWRQLAAMHNASRAQSVFTVIGFLQEQSLREDRGVLIALTDKPLNSWSEDEKASADRACAAYNTVGILVREGIVPERIIVDNWADSIKKCHRASQELLKDYRSKRGHDFWGDFDWLASKVKS